MVELEVTRDIEAPVDTVWPILEDYGDISWVGSDFLVEVIGEGIGMIRRITMGDAPPIDEVLTSQDAEAKTFGYEIPKSELFPFGDYAAFVRLEESGAGTRVIWRCQFDEGQLPADDARKMMEDNYKMLLDGLAAAAVAA